VNFLASSAVFQRDGNMNELLSMYYYYYYYEFENVFVFGWSPIYFKVSCTPADINSTSMCKNFGSFFFVIYLLLLFVFL